MRTGVRYAVLTMAAVAACGTAGTGLASSHREAPAITEEPKLDGTDFYMFRSYAQGRGNTVTFIANYQPLQLPYAGPSYYTMDPDALYEIHVDNDGDAVEDITFQFEFNNELRADGLTVEVGGRRIPIALRFLGQITERNDKQLNEFERYTLRLIRGDRRSGEIEQIVNRAGNTDVFIKPLDNVGNKTIPNYDEYSRQFVNTVAIPGCDETGRVFAGQRQEAFAVNLGESFDLVNYVPIEGDSSPGAGDGGGFPGGITQSRENDDVIPNHNVTTLALEVPIDCLVADSPIIGAWTTSSLPQAEIEDPTPTYEQPSLFGGAFVQQSRLSSPLVNELVIGLPQKNLFNAAEPRVDEALAEFVQFPSFPAILDRLFRNAVNQTLGTNIDNLAPDFFPRTDLVAAFLTGFDGLNQPAGVQASEMLRLNTDIAPKPPAEQDPLGVIAGDVAGFPNGRRPGDDVVDIELRVLMGRLCYPIPGLGNLGFCDPEDAPVGNVPFTDGAPLNALILRGDFPYLNPPLPGSPDEAREDGNG